MSTASLRRTRRLQATLLLGAALKIGGHEARKLAGLPVPPRPLDVNPAARLVGVAAISAALMALVAFVFVPAIAGPPAATVDPVVAQAATLPKPWAIQVDVLNGAGDINWTRLTASRIQSLAYTVKTVGRADRFDYPRSAVYYAPGGRLIAVRLARQIGIRHAPASRRQGPEAADRDRRAEARARLDLEPSAVGPRSSASFASSPAGIRSLAETRM